VSRTAIWTMHCKGNARETCNAEVTGASSEKELLELALAEGWHVMFPFQHFGYDACPKHIEALDRVDWASTFMTAKRLTIFLDGWAGRDTITENSEDGQ
jgi:allantoicase